MKTTDFSPYRRMMSDLAVPVLRRVLGSPRGVRGDGSVLVGASPALLLVADAPDQHAALSDGLRELVELDRTAKMSPDTAGVPVLHDPQGHAREFYFPLVLHLHLAAFSKLYETLSVHLWSTCEELMQQAAPRQIEAWASRPPPAIDTAFVLWQSLCLLDQADLAKRDADAELVDAVVHAIIEQPGPGGSLHPRDEGSAGESLDAWTYRELAGLHALTSLALSRRSAVWAERVRQITAYHLENTQPDNTTTEPWGIAGFLWSIHARSFGEQQLHDVQAGQGAMTPVTAMLLADAANALSIFESV